MVKVEIISTDTIKPSSPTPPHLLNFKLSLLDQVSPTIYISVVIFYSGDSKGDLRMTNVEKYQNLKKSLSQTLTQFYPLAGRLKQSDTIECNDEGVDFLEGRVNVTLSEFFKDLDLMELAEFVPCTVEKPKSGNDVLLAIQTTLFDCGGMALSIGISHAIADGTSLITLLNSWAAMARGAPHETFRPIFNSYLLFPPRRPSTVPRSVYPLRSNVKAKTIVFEASKIAQLRDTAAQYSSSERPTSVEALSMLIWRSVIRVQREVGTYGAYVALHAVSLRPRMVPPLPDQSFGNIWMPTFSTGILESEYNEEGIDQYLLRLLQETIRKVDTKFIKELQGPNATQKAHEGARIVGQKYGNYGIGSCNFTSWRRFPVYEADFGWGKPNWVCVCPLPMENGVYLLPTRSGDGIEVMVQMEKEELEKVVQDQELLSFGSFPSFNIS